VQTGPQFISSACLWLDNAIIRESRSCGTAGTAACRQSERKTSLLRLSGKTTAQLLCHKQSTLSTGTPLRFGTQQRRAAAARQWSKTQPMTRMRAQRRNRRARIHTQRRCEWTASMASFALWTVLLSRPWGNSERYTCIKCAQDGVELRRPKSQLAVMTCRVPEGGAELAQAHSLPGMFRLRASAPAPPWRDKALEGPDAEIVRHSAVICCLWPPTKPLAEP